MLGDRGVCFFFPSTVRFLVFAQQKVMDLSCSKKHFIASPEEETIGCREKKGVAPTNFIVQAEFWGECKLVRGAKLPHGPLRALLEG